MNTTLSSFTFQPSEQGAIVPVPYRYDHDQAPCPVPGINGSDPLGDACMQYADKCVVRASRVPGWLSTNPQDELAAVVNDYDTVGSVGQLSAVAKLIYALGAFSQTRFAGASDGNGAFTASITDVTTVPALGFRLDWGISLLSFAPFDLQVVTTGWGLLNVVDNYVGTDGNLNYVDQNADRNFTVRVSGKNGGSLFVPFATRPSGMSEARVCAATNRHTIAGVSSAATIGVTGVPAALIAATSVTVSLLTAHHSNTAAYLRAMKAVG